MHWVIGVYTSLLLATGLVAMAVSGSAGTDSHTIGVTWKMTR